MHVRKIQLTRFIYQTILKMTIVILGVLENIFEICYFKRTNLNSVGLGGLEASGSESAQFLKCTKDLKLCLQLMCNLS